MSEEPTAEPPPAWEEMSRREDMRELIAESAYYLSEAQGFAPGNELENWLAAEADVLDRLTTERLGDADEDGERTETQPSR